MKRLFLTTTLFAICSLFIPHSAEATNKRVEIQSRNISGGVNETDEQSVIGEDESTVLQNVILRELGKANKRDGSELTLDLTEVGTIAALKKYYKLTDSTRRLLIESDNGWQVWDGTDIFDLTTTGTTANTEFLVAGDIAWRLNPSDATVTWDGTDLSLSGSTNSDPPNSGAGLYHKGRVLLYGNTSNPDYFWYSSVGPEVTDLKTFDRSSNAIKIDSGDNQDLVALVEYGLTTSPGLLAFKERSTYYVDTSVADPASWTVIKVFNNVGTVARRSVVQIGGDVFFLSRDGGKYKVRTVKKTQFDKLNLNDIPLSKPIEVILSNVSDANISKAAAIEYDGYYILAYPSGSSTVNDSVVVYDTITDSWVQFTGLEPAVWETFEVSSTEALFFGDSDETHILKMFTGTDDNGTAIQYLEESRKFDMGFPHHNKAWKDIEVVFLTGGAYTADIYAQIDDSGWLQLGSVDLAGNIVTLPVALPFTLASTGKVIKTFELEHLGEGRTIKFKIENNETGIGSAFERQAVFLRGWLQTQLWESE